jgi:hypothetical protein
VSRNVSPDPGDSVQVVVYIAGQPVTSATANLPRPDVNNAFEIPGNHGYSIQIPGQFYDRSPHPVVVYAIDTSAAGGSGAVNTPIASFNFTWGDDTITNGVVSVQTGGIFAGAIDAINYNGVNFVNATDHGRLAQTDITALPADPAKNPALLIQYNPTEGGSQNPFDPSHGGIQPPDLTHASSSVLQTFRTPSDTQVFTSTQMGFWTPPNVPVEDPQDPNFNIYPWNTSPLSNYFVSHNVSLGASGMNNVVLDQTTLTDADTTFPINGWQYVPMVLFSPSSFAGQPVQYTAYNLQTQNLEPYTPADPSSGRFPSTEPRVAMSANGAYAIAVVSIQTSGPQSLGPVQYGAAPTEPDAGYGSMSTQYGFSWGTILPAGASSASYEVDSYIVVGNASTVVATLRALQAQGLMTISLAGVANHVGIASDGSTFSSGIGGSATAYSANLLGSSVSHGGNIYGFGAPGTNNEISGAGQTIALPVGHDLTLSFLGTAVFGNQLNQTFTVTYTDGSTQTFTQSLSDWFTPQGYPGESIVSTMPYRDLSNGTRDGRTFDLYAYSFNLNSAKLVQSITLPNNSDVEVLSLALTPAPIYQVNISGAFNRTGIEADGATFSSGGLDGGGYAYSGNQLGSFVRFSGASYALGPAGSNDVISAAGQTLGLPASTDSLLTILATAVNGNQPNQTFTVTYTDGSTQSFTQSFSDWFAPQGYSGEAIAVSMSHRDVANGTEDNRWFYLYAYSFTLNKAKTVQSIRLPVDGNLEIFALDLVDPPAPAPVGPGAGARGSVGAGAPEGDPGVYRPSPAALTSPPAPRGAFLVNEILLTDSTAASRQQNPAPTAPGSAPAAPGAFFDGEILLAGSTAASKRRNPFDDSLLRDVNAGALLAAGDAQWQPPGPPTDPYPPK